MCMHAPHVSIWKTFEAGDISWGIPSIPLRQIAHALQLWAASLAGVHQPEGHEPLGGGALHRGLHARYTSYLADLHEPRCCKPGYAVQIAAGCPPQSSCGPRTTLPAL